MRNWKNINKQDIEKDGDEINIYIGSDGSGNNYIVLKISDIEDIINSSKPN
jgi:hypothetical protein